MSDLIKRNVKLLCNYPLRTWKGWILFYWDHAHSCLLFNKKPKEVFFNDKMDGWDLSGGIEGISPYFLQACGVDVAFDVKGDEGEKFYYGPDCHHGVHPPIEMTLTLPEPLMEQLGL